MYKSLSLVLALFCLSTVVSAQPAGTKPFVLGLIDGLHSKVLNEDRVLNIYLPEGYKPQDGVRYPVIYLLDGSANEDFIHIAGLLQFNNFPYIDRVPKSIVVGIANIDRKRDFTYPTTVETDKKALPTTGGSAAFIKFIATELQPYIDKNYKTIPGARTIIGQSLGGLVSTEILLRQPGLFDRYIIISPSIWWDNGSLLKVDPAVLRAAGKRDVYIGVGKEGLAPTMAPHVMEVDANLLYDKLKGIGNPDLHLWFDYLPAETHATITHQAVFNAFRLLYPSK